MCKVFLSYSSMDREFVDDFYKRLEQDSVDCFYDVDSIECGDNYVSALERGLRECGYFVIFLTPAYCNSVWCQLERTAILAEDPRGVKKKFLVLLLEDCGQSTPLFLKPIHSIDISTKKKLSEKYPRICRFLGGAPQGVTIPSDRTKLPPVCGLLPHRRFMPYRSLGDIFMGRVKELWSIDDALKNRKISSVEGVAALTGMGGVGKTQLAVEYIHRFSYRFPGGIFWVDAESGIPSMISRVTLAAEIKINKAFDIPLQLNELWRLLDCDEPVLIVLDNFPEDEAVEDWLPPVGSVFTLITSRRKDFFKYFYANLNKLENNDALKLLNSGDRRFMMREALPLIEVLDGLPLALELVKNFLNIRVDLSINGILEEMNKLGHMRTLNIFANKYRNELPTKHGKEVSATFHMSWVLTSACEKRVLKVMSLLSPAPVPRRLIRKALKMNCRNGIQDKLDEALGNLDKRLSLVEIDKNKAPRIHRLIAAFVKSFVRKSSRLHQDVIIATIREMETVVDDRNLQNSIVELEEVLPHAELLLDSKHIIPKQRLDLTSYIAWHHEDLGRYRQALRYRLEALDIAETTFEKNDPEISRAKSNLAMVREDLGELEEAERLLREALASDMENNKNQQAEISKKQANLAHVLKGLGQLEEARDLYQETLDSAFSLAPTDLITIAKRKANLANVLRKLNKLDEAHGLLKSALSSAQKSLASGHPYIAKCQSMLGMVLHAKGELPGAKDMIQKALEAVEKIYKEGHLEIAIKQNSMGLILRDLGDYDEAEKLFIKAYEFLLKELGEAHPRTLKAKGNLESLDQENKDG